MKEGVQQRTWGKEMSATVLSAFYDMDMFYKVKVWRDADSSFVICVLVKRAVETVESNMCYFRRSNAK